MEVHVFRTERFVGIPVETEGVLPDFHVIVSVLLKRTHTHSRKLFLFSEMKPKWFKENEIPYKNMWLDDTYWWPYYLKNTNFKGYFKYRGYDTILEHNIKTVQEFEK